MRYEMHQVRQQRRYISQYNFLEPEANSQKSVSLVRKTPEVCMIVHHWLFNSVEKLYSILSRSSPFSLSINLGFSFSVFSLGWKVFWSMISTLYDLSIFFLSLSHQLEGFWLINALSGFLPLFSSKLASFSLATWFFETHQFFYAARIFLVVFWFSSSVFFIGLGGFSPGFHFSSMIPRSTEFVSEEKGNCNNVAFGAENF